MVLTRNELHALLTEFLGSDQVYFQPPENFHLRYPCIVYEFSNVSVRHADDSAYMRNPQYQITIMYRDPDSELPTRMLDLPGVRMDRVFRADNVYNAVFTISMT